MVFAMIAMVIVINHQPEIKETPYRQPWVLCKVAYCTGEE
jgi:hypothetical protein